MALTDSFEFPDVTLNSALGRHDGRVYEGLMQAAELSSCNRHDPFVEGKQFLQQVLDKEFLKDHATMTRASPTSSSKL